MLNGKIIENEPPKEPFSHYLHIVQRSNDPVLQKAIQDEAIKATKLFELLYKKIILRKGPVKLSSDRLSVKNLQLRGLNSLFPALTASTLGFCYIHGT